MGQLILRMQGRRSYCVMPPVTEACRSRGLTEDRTAGATNPRPTPRATCFKNWRRLSRDCLSSTDCLSSITLAQRGRGSFDSCDCCILLACLNLEPRELYRIIGGYWSAMQAEGSASASRDHLKHGHQVLTMQLHWTPIVEALLALLEGTYIGSA